ncbi:NADH dehydrogenase [ubiquinone] 1 beta subcomplex subunit 4 [Eleutherodactylus coqui]|uniref:NADH dehydrogenase [ubiquinone] 1 beta subcomplex subunit 4 n=1 Tax=Eleutherodactylus coqui TaxID=57060 RepID=A0A8J6ENK4_ELECQ|nr:hypothetical protein GDO78_020737 [Eleutherodactylus coqui]
MVEYKDYKESPLASRPPELDPARYFQQSPEQLRLQEKRESLRARLKNEYMLKLNDPHRIGLVHDPAVTRWMMARNVNVYNNFRVTPRNLLLGLLCTAGPFLFFYKIIMTDRENKEKLIREGKYDQPFNINA